MNKWMIRNKGATKCQCDVIYMQEKLIHILTHTHAY